MIELKGQKKEGVFGVLMENKHLCCTEKEM